MTTIAAVPVTARQHEVLDLLLQGLTNREIAERLVISEHTVRAHIRTLMDRFQAPSRTALVVRFLGYDTSLSIRGRELFSEWQIFRAPNGQVLEMCPVCRNVRQRGHAVGCAMAVAVAAWRNTEYRD